VNILDKLIDVVRGRLIFLMAPDSFARNVLTLVSGTAIAHAITALTLIAIARLYTPNDLGVLGLFASIYYILSVIACLRFDVAIPLPEYDSEARDVFWLALLSGVIVSILTGIVLIFIYYFLISRMGLDTIYTYLWILPFSLFVTACFSALQNWQVRLKSFGRVARARVGQSASASAVQICAGLTSPSPIGLIAGFVVNGGAATAFILAGMWRKSELWSLRPDPSRLLPAFKKYSFYPKYSTWEALANSASIQVPILLIGVLVSEAEIGQLLLAASVVQAPMALFGTATSQVFLSQAPERARQGRLGEITRDTMRASFKVGAPALLVIAIASPFVFPLVFGPEWSRAGIIAAWMAPWLLLQFIASPISMVLYIVGRQRSAFAIHIGGLLFRTFATWFGAVSINGLATEAYAISGAVFYLIMILLITRFADRQRIAKC
jgi:O-antigen/teichoic acid export membrane protein